MPLFSDLNSYYYSSSIPSTSHYYHMPITYSVPSRIATPFSVSYLSPLTAMMSAGIGLNPMPRGLMSRSAYTPILPTISEKSSPILSRRELGSPRSIGGKVYYRAPRPVVIDTANIDVSKRKKDEDGDETSTTGKIHRGRSVVRMHTKKLKENPGLKKKKTQGELLMEKFLIKEKPEPKEEPRRRRVWETDPVPENTTASSPQVTPTVSPSTTPICRRGTIKRYISDGKKKSGPLTDVEGTKEDGTSERKVSINELLKEEAAILDSMIQEEMAKSVNEMPTKRKKSGELPDIDDTGTKHKNKTKREGKLYAGKKSSKTLLLDSVDKSDDNMPKRYSSKKSSKTLPLDAINEIANNTLSNGSEDSNLAAEQKQAEGKIVRKSCKSYKKKHSGPLKFIIGTVHVEETSSPKPARKLNYEVIIEESTHRDNGIRETLRDIKKRKSKKSSVKRHYSADEKAEHADTVKIHDKLRSEGLTSIDAFDRHRDVTKLEESVDESNSIKGEIKNEERVPESGVKEKEGEINKSSEKNVEYDGTKLAVKNFLEKIVHKTDLPQMKDNVKHKIEKDAEIIEKSNKAKSAGKDVQNDTPSRDDYYDKFKTFNMLFKNAKENPVTAGNTNEVGVSTKCTDQDNLKQAIGFSLSTADQTKPDSMQPNTELKSIHSVGKVNNEKIIPNLIKSNEEKKTTKNVEVTKQTESKFLEKLKDVPGPPSSKITEISTEAATGDNKENYKSDYTHDIQSVEKVDIKDTEVVSGSDSKTSKMFKVGERTGKVSDKEITKVTPSKTEINANSKEKLQKADQKVDEKFHSESSKSMEKSTSLAETIYMKHSQGSLQEPGKKQNLNMKKPELSMEIGKVKELDVTDIKKVDNFNLASELMSLSMTENKNVISEKDDSLKGTPAADNLKANEILRTSGEKQTKDPKKDYQDTNKSDDCAPMTSQNEENVTVETNTTDKITSVDFKQLALAKKTKPLVKPRTSDVSTHEVVHESTKIENCKVGGSSEATPLSDKHVDNSLAIVNTTMADTVISSLEIQTCNSELDESESAKENREVNLDSSELNEVAVSEKKQNSLVKVDCSAKKVLDSQSGSTLKEVNCSVVSSDYMKPEVPDIQELKEQVNKTENICDLSYKEAENPLETSTFPKVSSSGSKQPLLSNKIDVSIKALKLDDSVYDANKLIKTEGLSVAGSTCETVPAVIEETDENLVTLSKMKQDKVFSPFEIHPEEQVKSEISGKEGKELVADDTTKTVLHILEVKDVSETAAPIEIAVTKKPDIKTKPVPPKDLKAPDKSVPITGEAEKLKTLGKSESFKETVGTVKENKTVKKSPVEDVTDVVSKETEPGSIKKFAKSSSKDDKQAESISTVKATKSPKSKKPEGSKLSPTKRKLLVKKKSTEEAAGSVEVVTLTDTSEKIVLPSEAESSQKKTEPVTENQKVAENTSVDCSCVKLRSPKKINTVIKVKATDKTVDKSDNSETNSVSKDTDVDKHSENVNLIPSPESSSDEESSTEEESSDEEETSSEEETSTESSDDDECDVNCHRKCEKLMPNLCGINQKLIVEALTSVKKGSVESKDKGSPTRRQSNAALSLDSLSSDSLDGFKMSRSGRVTPPATTIPRFRKYCIDDFQFLKVLGKGSFGKVLLAELKGTQYYYAVKCLKKDVVLEDDDVEYTLIERKVLVLGTKHPYLCHLFCTFQTDSHLFFVMEYLNGGDLMFHIQQEGRFDEGRARFYAAEIVSGLKFLHKKGIIYRDLKLDNILLDFDGHVRIADFGMCKLQIYLDKTADSFCGTPDYMAPEIIKGLKYNQCVDWWSFGILLYEMLVGQSPFSGCDEDDLFWCICNRQPQYPRYITIHAKKILSQLLEKESSKRLGSSENGATDIMLHSFFDGLDWQRLERRELMPPFKPNVKHPLDVQYFDKAFTAERARLTPIEPSILQSMDQTQFNGFSYTNPNVTD